MNGLKKRETIKGEQKKESLKSGRRIFFLFIFFFMIRNNNGVNLTRQAWQGRPGRFGQAGRLGFLFLAGTGVNYRNSMRGEAHLNVLEQLIIVSWNSPVTRNTLGEFHLSDHLVLVISVGLNLNMFILKTITWLTTVLTAF